MIKHQCVDNHTGSDVITRRSSRIIPYIAPGVFFLISILLTKNVIPTSSVLLAVLLSAVIYPILFICTTKTLNINFYLIIYALFAFCFYALFFPVINVREFSSDEVTRLRILYAPLHEIGRTVYDTEIGFHPLTYWIVSKWIYFIRDIPKPVYEFWYRFPYMLTHITSSLLFVGLIVHQMRPYVASSFRKITGATASFLLFFFNPVLFRHSIDVSPYAFVSLSSVVILWLVKTKQYLNPNLFPLQMLFILNSEYFWLLIVPISVVRMVITKKRIKETFIWLIAISFYQGILLSNLKVDFAHKFRVMETLEILIHLMAGNIFISSVIVFLLICAFFYNKNAKEIFLGVILSGLLICSISYFKLMHMFPWYFLYLLPPLIYLLSLRLINVHSVLLLLCSVILVWNWSVNSYQMLTYAYDYIGLGQPSLIKVAVIDAASKGNMLFIPSSSPFMGADMYEIYKNVIFSWYADAYDVQLISLDNATYCSKLKTMSNVTGLYRPDSNVCEY
jgi:hypothetical protein